jgi:hypothetical protein
MGLRPSVAGEAGEANGLPILLGCAVARQAAGVAGPATGRNPSGGSAIGEALLFLDMAGSAAFDCEGEAEFERVAAALTETGVENTRVIADPTLGKRSVAFLASYLAARLAAAPFHHGLGTGRSAVVRRA